MDYASLIPPPDAIPVAWGWFEGLNILTFALHILLVNILVGGTVIVLSFRSDVTSVRVVRSFSKNLPTVFALAVNFGVAPLLFLQVVYGHFFYVSSILSAVWWLGVIGLLILGYYALYLHQYRNKGEQSGGNGFLWFSLGVTLCIGLIMTSVVSLMVKPEAWLSGLGGASGTLLNLTDPTFVPRFLHFGFASVAVGGLALALYAKYSPKGNPDLVQKGLRIFVLLSILQMASGLWWLLSLDTPVLLSFIGDDTSSTIFMVVGIGLAVSALGAGAAGMVKLTTLLLVPTVLAMAGLRAIVRNETLVPHFSPQSLQVTGEISPFIFFLATLAIGLVVLAYMVRIAFRKEV